MARKKTPLPQMHAYAEPYIEPIGHVVFCHQFLSRELNGALARLIQRGLTQEMRAMLSQIATFEAKIDLFSQLANFAFRDKQTRSRIKRIVARLDTANGMRNKLIHGEWEPIVLDFGDLQLMAKRGRPISKNIEFVRERPRSVAYGAQRTPYTPKQVKKLAADLYQIALDLAAFQGSVEMRRASRRKRKHTISRDASTQGQGS